jgi:hypothetical protein
MEAPFEKKEVLGKRVSVKFEYGKRHKFFTGTIREIKMALPADGSAGPLVVQHFIVFDDNDKGWHDLAKLDGDNFLRWPKEDDDLAPGDTKPAAKRKRLKQDDSSPSNAKRASKQKRVKTEDLAPSHAKPASKRKQAPSHAKPASKQKQRQLEDTNEKGADTRTTPRGRSMSPDPAPIRFARHGGASEPLSDAKPGKENRISTDPVASSPIAAPAPRTAAVATTPENPVKAEPLPWDWARTVDQLPAVFLTHLDRARENDPSRQYLCMLERARRDNWRIASFDQEMILLDPPPEEWPTSITAIIQYMDVLEPGKQYFQRQQDSRGECSRTRKKLRTFARANPEHPAVKHWTRTQSWTPPDQAALGATIRLLKTMIK